MDLIILVIVLIICYCTGSHIEKKHYEKIRRREIALYKSKYFSFGKNFSTTKEILSSHLVYASVVMSCDRFKTFFANLKTIFGGNISAYESVLDRARREALLRIREQALKLGANVVINIKIDTISINPIGAGNGCAQVCTTAYATAIKYKK